uniref:Protein kinase domain-containing protein n=1 Tax=viral metagenome TaxID=1070528 RepID=A0A6C0ECW0_9ZZZZ
MIIQILYATYLMHSNNFYHQDIRTTNIGYVKTNLTHIKILKYNIPTYGYIFSLIDYGSIWNINFLYNNILEEYMFARRNFNYEDNKVMLVHAFLYNADYIKNMNNTLNIVRNFYKIILNIENNKKLSEENIKFYNINANKILDFDDIKYFVKNITNERKLIKYFYNKLDI